MRACVQQEQHYHADMTQSEAETAALALAGVNPSPETLHGIAEILIVLAHERAAVEDLKTRQADPLRVQWQSVLKPLSARLDAVEKAIAEGKAKYLAAYDARTKALQDAVDAGRLEDAEALTDTATGITVVSSEEIEIEDEDLIPNKYMVPDMKRIKALVKAGEDIPGIKTVTKKAVRIG